LDFLLCFSSNALPNKIEKKNCQFRGEAYRHELPEDISRRNKPIEWLQVNHGCFVRIFINFFFSENFPLILDMDGFTLGHGICHMNIMFSRKYEKIQNKVCKCLKVPHTNTWCVNRQEAKILWVGQHCSLASLTALKDRQQKHNSLPIQSQDPQFRRVVFQVTMANLIKS